MAYDGHEVFVNVTMSDLLLNLLMWPPLWRALGLVAWASGSALGLLGWRIGRLQERVERRTSHLDIEVNLANALPDWLHAFLPQSALGWCMWAVWMACGFCFLHFAKQLKQYY